MASDHKDITHYASVPTLTLPPGSCRRLTAEECLAKADECEASLEGCIDARTVNYLRKEIKGWRKLAEERADDHS